MRGFTPWPWLAVVCLGLVLLSRSSWSQGRRLSSTSASASASAETASSGDEYVEALHKTIALLQEKIAQLEKRSAPNSLPTAAATAPAIPASSSSSSEGSSNATSSSPAKELHKAVRSASMANMVGLDASSLLAMLPSFGSKEREKRPSKPAPAPAAVPAAAAAGATTTSATTTATTAPPPPPPPSPSVPTNDKATVTGLESLPPIGTNPALTSVPGPRGNFSFNPASSYQGPFFYLYPLPDEFTWRWPNPGTDCSENGYVGHEHAVQSGMGPAVLPEEGLFLTWHFSLFSSLYNRLKRSSRRTLDPEKAALFIIPYDLGLDGYLDARTCKNSRRCTAMMPQRLQQILIKQPYFYRHMGADHAVLWSLGQYHPWPHNGCDLFMRDFCGKCTFTCYWMDPQKAENRFVSVPFPSGYHWWDGIKRLPWQYDEKTAANRTLLAVYLGSTQTLNPAHTKIRRAMTTQCNASAECHWKQIGHTSKDTNIADFLSIYRRAKFCLCPPGDDPARKAVFDAILSGCIPVIFEVATLYNQYPWHIGEETALDISVSFPGGAVRSGKIDFMSILQSIPASTIRLKQQAIARLAPRIQYAMPPLHLLANRSDETPWDPPFPDGVEVALDGIFLRTSKAVANVSTGMPPRLQTNREWGQEYDVVKIKVPAPGAGGGGRVDSRSEAALAEEEAASKAVGAGVGGGLGGGVKGKHPHHKGGRAKDGPLRHKPRPEGGLGAPNEGPDGRR